MPRTGWACLAFLALSATFAPAATTLNTLAPKTWERGDDG
jgi:hypothetical protein